MAHSDAVSVSVREFHSFLTTPPHSCAVALKEEIRRYGQGAFRLIHARPLVFLVLVFFFFL